MEGPLTQSQFMASKGIVSVHERKGMRVRRIPLEARDSSTTNSKRRIPLLFIACDIVGCTHWKLL